MKIFGHNGFFSKIDHGIDKALHEANNFGKKVFGDNSWYVGTDAPGGIAYGQEAEAIMNSKLHDIQPNQERQIYDDDYQATIIQQQQQQQQTKPKAYQANVAGTANSIAQGGMTKKEVQEFNIRHPNETAIRRN